MSHSTFRPGSKWFPLKANGVFDRADVSPATTCTAMEKLFTTGKPCAIRVSNVAVKQLEDLLNQTKIVPATNQVEAHLSSTIVSFQLLQLKKYFDRSIFASP
ncbi:hypothetical protein P154DRAFT_524244 [Amniculicola lignicola CBS 123094]|uniref:Uncharacterized protein n=1 Tax=Amniculicola lignicola CBS 123094 TaxID=1392246 RepID=A0A6A5W860_9PLEO|nr:hypothetical protein P154DRAFT_524244 [Amniculicola lignicola CBS 123094]